MKKGFKVAGLCFLGILVLCFIGGLLLTRFFSSPQGSRYLLDLLQKAATKNHAQFQYRRGSVYPFSSLSFEDLEWIQEDFKVALKKLDLRFSFSLGSRSLTLSQFEVRGAQVRMVLPQEAPLPEKKKEFSSDQLIKLLFSPLIRIRVDQFDLSDLNVELEGERSGFNTRVRLQGLQSHSKLEWMKDQLSFHGTLECAKTSQVSLLQKIQNGISLEFRPYLNTQLDLSATREGRGVYLALLPSRLYGELNGLNLVQDGPESFTRVSFENVVGDSTIEFLGTFFDLNDLQKSLIQKLKIRKNFTSPGGQVVQTHRGKESRWKIGDQKGLFIAEGSEKTLSSDLNFQVKEISSTGITLVPLFLNLTQHLETTKDLQNFSGKGTVEINHLSLLQFEGKGHSDSEKKETEGTVNLQLHIDPRLSKLFKAAAPLREWGPTLIPATLKAKDSSKGLEIDLDGKIPRFQTEFNAKGQRSTDKKVNLNLQARFSLQSKPIIVQSKVEMNEGDQVSLLVEGKAPEIEVKDLGRVYNTEFRLKTSPIALSGEGRVDAEFELKQGDLLLESGLLETKPSAPLAGLRIKGQGSIQDRNHFVIQSLEGSLNQEMVKLQVEGQANLRQKDFQFQGALGVHVPKDFPSFFHQQLTGKIEFPWILSGRQNELSFQGKLAVQDLTWSRLATKTSPFDIKVSGISGRIPISEQLRWEHSFESLRFASLIDNPFERVDFERVQPMMSESEPIFIRSLSVDEKAYGPFQGFFSLRQNMIYSHKVDMKIGEGHLFGELFLDPLSSNREIGFHTRLSGVDLNELIPKRYLRSSIQTEGRIHARTGLVYNFEENNLDGRIDMTEISRDQLLTLLNGIDPDYKNTQINRARFALGIAYPSYVQMKFQKSFMDLLVQVSGALNQEFQIRGVPLAAWLSQFKGNFLRRRQEGRSKE